MSTFGTQGVQEAPEYVNKWIKPGIQENVVVHSIEGVEPEGKSPYLEVAFRLTNGTDQDLTKVKFYMSESARPKSLEKIKHIATKLVTEEQIDAVTGDDLVTYGANLNRLLSGKAVREFKFIGEEYINASGEVKVKATIGLPKFASREVGTLTYDKNNQYDYKKVVVADAEQSNVPVTADSGLPF